MLTDVQEPAAPPHPEEIVVCIPVFNDWVSCLLLLEALDGQAGQLDAPVSVVLVDDGSTDPAPERLEFTPKALRRIDLLHLRRNLGHQRAIALGLCFIHQHHPCRAVVVMDGDGEDCPSHLPALLRECAQHKDCRVVFARRTKRTEGLTFRLGYLAYKTVHLLLTGYRVEVGNFSVIPHTQLERLVGVSEIWNHFAAAVIHARLPVVKIPIPRGHRLAGRSRMNFTALVLHGLSAISVYADRVGIRFLVLTSLMAVLAMVGLLLVVFIRLTTDLAIPGWATTAAGTLTVLLFNLLALAVVFVQVVLSARNYSTFLPLRDWHHFVIRQGTLHG